MKKLTTKDFIDKSIQKHGFRYDYSLVSYNTAKDKIKIVCKIHGVFIQSPNMHLCGRGCKKCGDMVSGVRLTNNEFIGKANKIHNNKYDYSLINYKNNSFKVKIICDKHGEFRQTPHDHLSGRGCPMCNESKGEKMIRKFLIENRIEFERNKKFDECRHRHKLPFDFYLPKQNILVEFDGRQHFEAIELFNRNNGYEKTKKNDEIKNQFANNNKIKLLRISYKEINDIDNILNNTI